MTVEASPTEVGAKSNRDSRIAGNVRRQALFVLEDLGGGTGNHVCRMLEDWSALGWRATVVTHTPPLVRLLPAGVDIQVVRRAGWYDRFPLAQLRRLFAIWSIVRRVRPDVVHTYFYWSIVYGRLLKLLGVLPVLVENREDTGFSWTRRDYRLLRLTARIPDRIVCVADAVRRTAVEREGVDSERAIVIHNGIELRESSRVTRHDARRQLGFEAEDVVIGMVANLPRAVKGGRRLLDSVPCIVAAVPTARFLLVGQGTDAGSLQAELHARGIAQYVRGVGYRRDVDVCYAAMDISVLTSSTEGLSITLLESMRSGLPTVVTNVGGNAEVVEEGVTGFLVPVHDSSAFVERVATLARDASLRRAMGDAGRRRVAKHFAIEHVADRYIAVYEELLGRAGSRPELGPVLSRTVEECV